jgi:predicted DNA-binding protein
MTRKKISKDRRKVAYVTVRLSENDKSRIELLAVKAGLTASDWIRKAVEHAAFVEDANNRVQRTMATREE